MKTKILLLLAAVLVYGCSSCNKNKPVADITLTPDAGTRFKAGDIVPVKVSVGDSKPDSIVYLVDSVRIGSKKDTAIFSLKTDSMPVGPRMITARVYQDGKNQEASTNIVLLAAKAPDEYTYQVIKKYPHDTSSYTEGLLYQDGYLYESTGNPGHSYLKKVNLETGKTVQAAKLDDKYFGEGSAIIGDKILMLTYRDPRVGLVYDKTTFKLLRTFPYNVGVEGWGLCFDGKKLYTDDSTDRIWFLDKNDYHPTGYIEVYDDKDSIPEVNELEYINGKLYSNIYTKDTIIVINPKTGAVEQRVDMKNLWPLKDRPAGYNSEENVLNGIAWDEKGKRLFVTGKKWPYLYQVKFVKK